MGMFDFVRSEVPLPDGFTGELQTKSLHSTLRTILIRADGRLMVEEVEYEKAPFEQGPSRRHSRLGFISVGRRKSSRWRDLNFHGDLIFYGSDSETGEWHSYVARFTYGQLEHIRFAGEQTVSQRTADFQGSLLSRSGGALSAEQVKSRLGYKSARLLNEAVADRQLLAVDVEGVQMFPSFQFVGNRVCDGMAAVLAAVPNTSPWEILQYFVAGDEGLGDLLPMDLVKGTPEDVELAVRFARTLEI